MAEVKLPKRSEIPDRYKWNAESVFTDQQAWEAEFDRIVQSLSTLDKYRGHLGEGPAVLAAGFEAVEDIFCRTFKAAIYAHMSHEVDTQDMAATGMVGKVQGLIGQVMAASSFLDPELIAIGREKLRSWSKEEAPLEKYAHYFDNLFRKQAHIRSPEVEEVVGLLADPFSSVGTTMGMLVNADFKHKPALTKDGQELPVSEGTIDLLLASEDREARRTAWENYSDTFLAYKNTLASNLATSIKQNVFKMRVRRHSSTLEASLFENNVPEEVFYNLIETYKKNLPTWHRYWRIRRKALGVEQLHPYDIWAPLTRENPELTFEESVDWISKGLQPMGEDYVSVLRKGCLEQRWVDVLPNQGKSGGAFSGGSQGTYPFILMSYDNTIFSLSTLAHELGHSMHSYLIWQNQPFVYSDYSLF
ncbi:MAG: M3 family oligoendopeptidase, partial [Omnitrophica WOR_2 bacterium]